MIQKCFKTSETRISMNFYDELGYFGAIILSKQDLRRTIKPIFWPRILAQNAVFQSVLVMQ